MLASCPTHEKPMKLIPAGISKKTGNPYKAFYACTSFNCKETAPAVNEPDSIDETKKFEEEMENGDYSVNSAVKAFEKEVEAEEDDDSPMKKTDWERKDRRISRLTLAKSFISAGVDFDNARKNNDLEKWEKWIWTGEAEE